MKIAITTGGTGGHIYPALALSDVFIRNHDKKDVVFIGSTNRMEATIIPNEGYTYYGLDVLGLKKGIANKVSILVKTSKAYFAAKKILKKEQPNIVIGFGGYVSAPVMLAARHLKIPTMIHEQNSVVGKSNHLLEKKASGIVTCYEEVKSQLKNPKVENFGNPRATLASESVFDKEYAKSLGMREDVPNILIVMGSLGSSTVNEVLLEILPKLSKMDAHFIWVSGKSDYEKIKSSINYDNIVVVDYIKQLDIIKGIDVMLCRAGATTSAEVCSAGVASILIPSPYVAHNHQYYNAKALADVKAAWMLEEKDVSEDSLSKLLEEILSNPNEVEFRKKNALALGKPNAAYDILSWCEKMKR